MCLASLFKPLARAINGGGWENGFCVRCGKKAKIKFVPEINGKICEECYNSNRIQDWIGIKRIVDEK